MLAGRSRAKDHAWSAGPWPGPSGPGRFGRRTAGYLLLAALLPWLILAGGCGGGTPNVGGTTGNLVAAVTVARDTGDTHYPFAYQASLRADGAPVDTFDVRWDWTDDGVYDTPYLSVHDIDYQFGLEGPQRTRAQVRTPDGRLAEATVQVTVTPDLRHITIPALAIPTEGTTQTDFEFTSYGGFEGDQHFNWGYIRADWNLDGLYDTPWMPYEDAPDTWCPRGPTRRFDTPGPHTVRLQVTYFDNLDTVDTHEVTVVVS
jgi:hypothetical protein